MALRHWLGFRQGPLGVVRLLLEKGADVNANYPSGVTALIWASREGHLNVVKLLLEKGADVNARDKFGRTALMMAAQWGMSTL